MRLAVSNIAWLSEEEPLVAGLMAELGIGAVEVAPTRIRPDPLAASDAELRAYRRFWNDRGIEIVALQALLFGRPELTLFESAAVRARTLEYLRGILHLAAVLGAGPLVFGSPKNRRLGAVPRPEAEETAVAFFRAAGEAAVAEGVVLCVEPNPQQYDCDFVTTSAEGLDLVRKVDHPGFGLHLDAAGMTLAGEPLEEALARSAGSIRHFHASEPFLGALGRGGVDHATLAAALRKAGYLRYVSLEMRRDERLDAVAEVREALGVLRRFYGEG